jgi:hypothetical protein
MHALDPVWETIKDQFTAARHDSAQEARRQVTSELNQLFRRLRQYQTEGEWRSAILDGAARFVREVALFTYQDGVLNLRGQRNLNLAENLSFSAGAAAAFKNVISSKDTLVALRTPAEVGEALSSPHLEERAHIVPILNGPRVVALLFAVDERNLDLNAIELIAGFASTVLERQSNASLHTQIASQSVTAAAERVPHTSATLPDWANLSEDQRVVHVRAQRFARVKVAEMQLSRPDACHAGRQQGNLYVFLKQEIDKARDTYRRQFMTIPSIVDYLHIELVRTAAEGDEQKLGADYPGQLV